MEGKQVIPPKTEPEARTAYFKAIGSNGGRKSRGGLANASLETRIRVSRLGGQAKKRKGDKSE